MEQKYCKCILYRAEYFHNTARNVLWKTLYGIIGRGVLVKSFDYHEDYKPFVIVCSHGTDTPNRKFSYYETPKN